MKKLINKIAKKIIKNYRNNILVLNDIDDVLIVVTNESINTNMKKYASVPRISRWSLLEIKQLIKLKNPRYKFLDRNDDKNNPACVGLTKEECLESISQLTESEYSQELSLMFPDTNVYIKKGFFDKNNKKIIDLYIKLSIIVERKDRKVLIISFHPTGM